jgi:MFS family permease
MDFAGAIETWRRVLTQPGEPVFEQERANPNGTLQTALIWMVIAGVVAAIFGWLAGVIGAASSAAMLSQVLPPEARAEVGPMLGAFTGGAGLVAIIVVPVGFLIGTFILHLIAKVLGGQGDYGKFAYLVSTYQAPLTMVSSILSIIPFLGGCIGLLIVIYTYVESYFAVKVNYGLTSGKAIITVLIPLILVILLFGCIAVLAIAGIAALSGNNS